MQRSVEAADSLPHAALALFFLIFGLGACFGWETGYVCIFAGHALQNQDPELNSYARAEYADSVMIIRLLI